MPRRDLLTPTERAQLFAFPEDAGELIRLATLSRADMTYIQQHRGDHNRLGLAEQMTYLRHPSRVIAPREARPAAFGNRGSTTEAYAGSLVVVRHAR